MKGIIPNEIKDISKKVGPGSMVAIKGKPHLILLIKDTKERFDLIPENPIIETIPSVIRVIIDKKTFWVHMMLLRLCENPNLFYDTCFNYYDKNAWDLFKRMAVDPSILVIATDGSNYKAIIVKYDELKISIKRYISLSKLDIQTTWNDVEYECAVKKIYDTFPTNQSIFDTLMNSRTGLVTITDE